MRFSVHRLFLVIVVALAATWGWAAAMVWKHKRVCDEYVRLVFQPELDRFKREIDRTDQAVKAERPLEPVPAPSEASLNELMERRRVLDHYWSIRENALLGLFATIFCWVLTGQIQLGLRRRARAAADRAAEPTAGHLVGELVEQGRSFTGRSKPDGSGIEVEVDGKRAMVVFRNLAFVAAFSGNRRQPMVELPFSELLALTTGYNKGTAYLNLRTTAGRVFWTDKVRPFDTLVALLDDIIELNRNDPAAYRAARAREPVIHTPWYGWAILATGVGAVVALSWYFLSHPQ